MKEILDFNRKQENRDLQNFYSSKSFMEACGIGRDEKAHSAFIAWLIKDTNDIFKANDTPLMWLLQAIISRADNSKAVIPQVFTAQVLSRKLRYTNLQVTPEYLVKDANQAYFTMNWPSKEPSDDRMDIFIRCNLLNCPQFDELEIVIENKVMSTEEGPKSNVSRKGYDDYPQTVRYYNVVSSNGNQHKVQLFVYLKPGLVGANTTAACNQFIQINYQDILDYILTPLLDNEDISNKLKWRVQDYVEGLSLPTLDTKAKKRIIMARTADECKRLDMFINNNHELLFNALAAKARKDNNAKTLSGDDELLELTKTYTELFCAVADHTNGDIDFVSSTPVSGNFMVNRDLKVYNNMNFGFRFLELFYEQNKPNLNNALSYADQLNNLLTKFFGARTSWYGEQAKDPAHYRVLDEANDLSAMFGNFDQGKLAKLKAGIICNKPKWFTFIEY